MPARVEHLANLVARDSRPSPLHVVGQALEALDAEAEPVRPHDDLAPQLVLVGVAQVRRAGGAQSRGEIHGIRWLAREVLLERNRLDLGLEPSEDDLVFRGSTKVVHRAKDYLPPPS